MRVAFQGEPGAYSEAAVLEFFSAAADAQPVEAVPQVSFDAVFAAVEAGACACGLIPIENSLAGSIHRNYDLLLRHQLSIVGEYYLRVRHCLIAHPGVSLPEIRKVISHPQALSQCEAYLSKLGLQTEAVYDTAGSVKILAEQGERTLAAIASRRAAELYGMQILAEGIEDSSNDVSSADVPIADGLAANFTRFLVITPTAPAVVLTGGAQQAAGPGSVEPRGDAKTSIVFTLRNTPGALFKALSVFALRDIDLTKIESRPLVNQLWQYFFYIDIAGSAAEPAVSHALDNLREYALMLRVLGSYPRHRLNADAERIDSKNFEEK
jgi:prephenate dehydratase